MNDKKYLLFDFDGVVVDSLSLAFSINQKNRGADFSLEDYRQLFTGNIFATSLTATVKKTSNQDFFTQYEPGILELECVPGMPELIKHIATKFSLIIISSTLSSIIERFLQKHGLINCFAEIMGPEVERSKTKKIQMVFEKYNTNADDCLFITDTSGDIREAAEVGVKSIGVTWGYHEKEMIVERKPYAIAYTPKELESLINTWATDEL